MNAVDTVFPFSGELSGLDAQSGDLPRGIKIRDAIAIHLLQGILANPEFTKKGHSATGGPRRAADMAYEYADALIEASE